MWVIKIIFWVFLTCLSLLELGVKCDEDQLTNSVFQNHVDSLKVPRKKLIEAFRDVFKISEEAIISQKNNLHSKQQTFPQYMLDMYKKMQTGQDNLPLKANTVRCLLPLSGKFTLNE